MKKPILTMSLLIGAAVAMAVPTLLGTADLGPAEAQSTAGMTASLSEATMVADASASLVQSETEEGPTVGVSIGTVEAQLYSESGLTLENFGGADYVAKTSENTYWGFFGVERGWTVDSSGNDYYDKTLISVKVCALSSSERDVTMPDSVMIDGVALPVKEIYCYSLLQNGFNENIKSITIPATVNYLNNYYTFNPYYAAVYMLGEAPTLRYGLSEQRLFICSKDAFGSYLSNDNYKSSNLFPFGWDFEWVTVDVVKSGEFAETYLTQNNFDWGAAYNVKVTGNINDTDLNNMKNLTSLKKLDLSETEITSLPENFMNGRSTLYEIKLPETLTAIGKYAFYNCKSLSLVESNVVKTIGMYAFESCTSLQGVNLTGTETVDDCAFRSCTSLSDVDLSTLQTIGRNAFQSCTSLSSADLSAAQSLGSYAFYNCKDLKSVVLSDLLTQINNYSFQNTALETLTIPEGVTTINTYAFYGCQNLTKVEVPSTLTTIGYRAFGACASLADIKLKTGLIVLEEQSFYGCTSLEEITIPSTVKSIGSGAFNSTNIKSFKCYAVVPPVANSKFIGANMDMSRTFLYVPPFSKDYYRNTANWSDFYLMSSINDQIDYIYIDRPLTINLEEEDNDVVANNPAMDLTYDANNSKYIGQLTATGAGTLSAGQLNVTAQLTNRYFKNYFYCPTLINYADKMRADNVSHTFKFYRNYSSSEWHFISLPYDVKVSDIIPGEDTHWVIRRYDSAARAAGEASSTWVDLTNDDTLEAGKGYIVSSRSESDSYRSTLTFTSGNSTTKNNIFRSTDAIVPLSEYVAEFAHNRSWNLVGNPYPCYFDMHYLNEGFTAPVTVWNYNAYVAYSPVDDDLVLAPYEAFFVQCPLDATQMTFKEAGRLHHSDGQPKYKMAERVSAAVSAEGRNVFNFNLNGDNADDRARIVLNPEALADYEVGRDASKFFASAAGAQIYVNSGISYSIDERPVGDGCAVLGLRDGSEEACTLSLSGKYSDEWSVMLTDHVTGITVDLTEEEYHFTSTGGDDSMRFSVMFVLGANGESGIQSVLSELGDAEVTVAGVNGSVVYKGAASDIKVPAAGIYVISAGSESHKAILK